MIESIIDWISLHLHSIGDRWQSIMRISEKYGFFRYCKELGSLILFALFSLILEFLPPSIRNADFNDSSLKFPFIQFEIISALLLPVNHKMF
jgi:hypothetical protein